MVDRLFDYGAGAAGPPFNPFEDPNTVAERWRIWIRNFGYYLEGQIGLNDKKKIARLLHQAGPEVQEIYETIENEPNDGETDYDKCVNRLNAYFSPEPNVAYERQKFRDISMVQNETMDQFVLKLRKQAKYCKFDNLDEVIRDQVVEKCSSPELKRKLLKKGKDLTLKLVLETGRLFEMEKKLIESTVDQKEPESEQINKVGSYTCYRCGRNGHLARDSSCPALTQSCKICGLRGHFANSCKTKSKPNIIADKKKKDYKKGKKRYVKYVIEENDSSEDSDSEASECEHSVSAEVNSIYAINERDNRCSLKVGKHFTCQFIIDSGASVNIIDRHVFNKLQAAGLNIKLRKPVQKYFAYGGKEINQVGVFQTSIYSPESNIEVNADILVYGGCGPSLLSKQTSVKLGLLRLGVTVNDHNINSVGQVPITKEYVIKEFPTLFDGVGKLKNFSLKIPIDPNVKLVAQPIRRQPFNMREVEEGLIKELLNYDIIEPVTGPTPCVSPSHIVKKKEKGQYRLVIDMRKANEAVLRERVPLPTFEELLADLNYCKYFSSIDIKWGYHQLMLDEDSRMITVFSSSLGLFRYKRLFFGIRCASEMFQRVIAQLLQGIEGVANSQDDIRIGGRTREEHDSRLRQVLHRLHDSGLTLNEKKCSFGLTEINFLGHHLSAKGIKPTQSSQQVVQEFRAPQNKAEVRSFLGLVNFSARFIPNFSTLTEPLRQLIKKDTDFIWNSEHEQTFQHLKSLIAKAPALGYYDKQAETTVVTDASPVGIAAVLIQHQSIDNQLQPIAIKYISKSLSPTEQRYSQTEKEALAIVWACENLYMYLMGKEFKIISDHKPLEIIYSPNSQPSARIQRWVLRLQPYTFKVIYKPGKNNIADPLSRLLEINNKTAQSTEDNEDQLLISSIEASLEAVTIDEIRDATSNDTELVSLLEAIEKDSWSKEQRKYELMKTELCVVNNIILRGTRIIIPQAIVPRILDLGHEGHLSVNSMKGKLRSKVWWKGMEKDIEHWVDTCEGCRLVRNSCPEPITSTKLPSKVWELVAIDYLGPLPSGHYLLFVVDYYSRYFEVEILRNQTAESTVKTLEKIIAREGIMDEIVCDNGPAFRDKDFQNFLKTNGIRLRHTTPLWPQANGEVERQNRNVLRRLRIAQAMKLDWKRELLTYLSAFRTTPHSTTGEPPGNVFRGRKLKTKLPDMTTDFYLDDEQIRDMDRYKKDTQKQYADKRRHAKVSDISPGDTVLLKQKKENKLSTPFSPVEHKVVWKSGNAVEVQSPDGKIIRRNSSHFMPVKERDLRRFSMVEKNQKEDEEYKGGMINNGHTQSSRASIDNQTQILTDPNRGTDNEAQPDTVTETRTRPQRLRQSLRPVKYNDFVLNLILDTLSE